MRLNQAITVIPINIRKLRKVKIRLPPARLFDEPLGFTGSRRFFALCWSRADEAPILNDGIIESIGVPDFYRAWRYHPAVIAALIGYNIGDAAITADHMLLVDRTSRTLYVGKVWDILEILDSQKNGIPEPTDETGSVYNSGTSIDMQEEGAVAAKKGYDKPMNSDIKLLNQLEAWMNANIKDG